MGNPSEERFDPQRLNRYWGKVQPAGPEHLESTLQIFARWRQMIENQLPGRIQAFGPFLARVEELLAEQEKAELGKAQLAKNQEGLKEALDRIEDLLDALVLAGPKSPG